jgi:hypothetical protein
MANKTGGTKILNHCELCKYFHLEVQQDGGCLELCAATGEQLSWSGVRGVRYNKSDRCPFREAEDDK